MTEQELAKVPFHFVGHVAMADEHTSTYANKDGRLGFCEITKVVSDDGFGEVFGRTRRHYRIGSTWYKSRKKFLEALKDFEL